MVKVQSGQGPSSTPVPPPGAPGGSGQPGTPRASPGPLGAQPLPRVPGLAASKAADLTPAFNPTGDGENDLEMMRMVGLPVAAA